MIIDLIISIVCGLLGAILSALPAFTLPSFLTSTWPADLSAWVGQINGYFPIYTVGLCLGVILGLRALLAVWAIAVWLYERFPFKFT